jgi:hypothetical protein
VRERGPEDLLDRVESKVQVVTVEFGEETIQSVVLPHVGEPNALGETETRERWALGPLMPRGNQLTWSRRCSGEMRLQLCIDLERF